MRFVAGDADQFIPQFVAAKFDNECLQIVEGVPSILGLNVD
jgi:hypothetical protein